MEKEFYFWLMKKKSLLPLLILSVILICSSKTQGQQILTPAQDVNSHSPKPAHSSRMEKKAEKKKVVRQKKADKALEKGRLELVKIQTKAVQKRMKESKRKAKRHNENKREFFLKRWFTKKHR
jgi:hypothetical protein